MYIAVYVELPMNVSELTVENLEKLGECFHAHAVIEYHGNQQRGIKTSFNWERWMTSNNIPCKITVSEGDGVLCWFWYQ